MPALLEVRDAVGGYGETQVLHGLDLTVEHGQAIGLVGPNGHGKSTLLNHISGLRRLRSGSIVFDDHDITHASSAEIVERGFIQVPQGNQLFSECSVQENLELGSYPKRARAGRKQNLELVFELFPKLAQRRRQLAHTLSGGERQMLAVGVGLMSQPRLLVLDEPTLGLAPSIKSELFQRMLRMQEETDLTLVVIDGDLSFVLGLTRRWSAVLSGRVVAEGESSAADAKQSIIKLMFGEGAHA